MGKIVSRLGSVDQIALGHGKCFIVDGQEIAVFRKRSGSFVGVSNRCPHRNGPLCDGVIDEQNVICPYHGHKFNLETGQGGEPSEKLKTFSILEKDQEIFLDLLGAKIKEPTRLKLG